MTATEANPGELRSSPREVRATVVAALPNAMFRLRLPDGTEVLGHVSGPLRMQFTRLLPGDQVVAEVSPFDHGKARIAAFVDAGRRPARAGAERPIPTTPTDNSESQP